MEDVSYFPFFPQVFGESALVFFGSVKAGSEIMEKGLLCSGERRKRSLVALIDFIDELL